MRDGSMNVRLSATCCAPAPVSIPVKIHKYTSTIIHKHTNTQIHKVKKSTIIHLLCTSPHLNRSLSTNDTNAPPTPFKRSSLAHCVESGHCLGFRQKVCPRNARAPLSAIHFHFSDSVTFTFTFLIPSKGLSQKRKSTYVSHSLSCADILCFGIKF